MYTSSAKYFINVITECVNVKDRESIHKYCQALRGLEEIAVVADCLRLSKETIENLDNKHSKIVTEIQSKMEKN